MQSKCIWMADGSKTVASCRYDLEIKNVFPTRGRSWCKWEEDFLADWIGEFGLHECARQLGRTPSSVALRCSWLGIRKPKQAEAEPKLETQTPEKAPERPAEAKEEVSAVVLHENTGDAPERLSEAQNGHVPEKAQETGLDLESMSRLDILRAIASGKLEAASVG